MAIRPGCLRTQKTWSWFTAMGNVGYTVVTEPEYGGVTQSAENVLLLTFGQEYEVMATWPMREFQANFPMALDEANQRLFVGCRSPARLVVLDTTNGKPVANLPISEDTDDLFYHAAAKRIYLSCGEGYVDVIDQRDADHYQFREKIPTRSGARTSFFATGLDKFFLAVPQRANKEAEINLFQALN